MKGGGVRVEQELSRTILVEIPYSCSRFPMIVKVKGRSGGGGDSLREKKTNQTGNALVGGGCVKKKGGGTL